MAQSTSFFDPKNNPFFDPEKNPFMNPEANPFFSKDATKAFTQFPELDVESVFGAQRKNMEAVAKANQKALEGVQAAMSRQAEFMSDSFQKANAGLQNLGDNKGPGEQFSKQAEATKAAMEDSIQNMRELSDMVMKSQRAAMDIISDRIADSLEEMKSFASKTPAKGK